MKNALVEIKSRINNTEKPINELEDREAEITDAEQKEGKK